MNRFDYRQCHPVRSGVEEALAACACIASSPDSHKTASSARFLRFDSKLTQEEKRFVISSCQFKRIQVQLIIPVLNKTFLFSKVEDIKARLGENYAIAFLSITPTCLLVALDVPNLALGIVVEGSQLKAIVGVHIRTVEDGAAGEGAGAGGSGSASAKTVNYQEYLLLENGEIIAKR